MIYQSDWICACLPTAKGQTVAGSWPGFKHLKGVMGLNTAFLVFGGECGDRDGTAAQMRRVRNAGVHRDRLQTVQ
jgi:hypothetical protein